MDRPTTITWARRVARLAVVSLLALPCSCFSLKTPPCAFTCVQPPHACPEGYTCGDDGLCHRDGTDESCHLTAPDGGLSPDTASQGQTDDAGAATGQ
ncbi:MAG: hypothetical protein ABUS79_06655 [Pseudomonadota bacterium]